MLHYLRDLPRQKVLLWCYLIWYLSVAIPYFEADGTLWLNSLGLSGIIGTGLYVGTAFDGGNRRILGAWTTIRFYLMPFCVSSFAALIKGRGFVLIFHPHAKDNLTASAGCLAFASVVLVAKRLRDNRKQGTNPPACTNGADLHPQA